MLALSVFLTCMVITAMMTDISRFIIPNLLVVIILLTYPTLLFIAPVMPDWKIATLIGLATFFAGFILFALKVMGGGDVKLLAVMAIFVGKASFVPFLTLIAIFGGVLSVLLLLLRPFTAYVFSKFEKPAASIPQILTTDAPVPYGVAIGLSFLTLLWGGQIPGIAL